MGLFDKLLGKESKVTESISTAPPTKQYIKLDLEKPLTLDLVKGMRSLDLNKPDVLASSLFLIDTSGSMDDRVKKVRKIEAVREVMAMIPNANKICFSSNVHITDSIPEPNGGTNMARAFEYVATMKGSNPKKIVIVSDGEPDNKALAFNSALKLHIPVDVIYIGAEGDRGEAFMKELASKTGGKQLTM